MIMTPSATNSPTSAARESKFSIAVSRWLRDLGLPILGIAIFTLVWQGAANQVHTSLGQFPGPTQVLVQAKGMYAEYREDKEREAAFYERQSKRNADRVAEDPSFVAD